MKEIKTLKEMFGTGTVPAGGNAKKFQKLLKKYGHLVNPLFVNLYPVRDCRYDDMTYRVFAIPVNSESIDDETLRSIKDVVNSLPVGSIRYNAAASGSRNIQFEDGTGKYLEDEENTDDIMAVSNHYDGIVLFTMAVFNGKVAELDCNYAIFGKWDGSGFGSWTDYTILPIENVVMGKECDKTVFSNIQDAAVVGDQNDSEEESPAVEKVKSAFMTLSAIITIGLLIWYFLFR